MTRREQEKKTKEQIVKLFGGILVGLGIIFAIQVIGKLVVAIMNNQAGWWGWSLTLSAEVLLIGSFLSPALWHRKEISSKQHNAWTQINFGGWTLWIVASGIWYYLCGA